MSVFLILWYSDIHIYLLSITLLVVPHIPVGIATLCMDHLEKVTASTARFEAYTTFMFGSTSHMY